MATPRGSGKPLQCPHCNRPLHPMQTPEGLSVETCLPCKGVWVHGEPDRPAPRADSSIPIPFNCPSCVDPILTELRYRRENDELRVEYCRNCHGVWMEQGRLAAWTALVSPPPAAKPVPRPSAPPPKPAAPPPRRERAAAPPEVYSPDDDLNYWRRMIRPALLVFGILIGLVVVRAMFSGEEPPKPAPPPKESRESERPAERRERARERPVERRAAEPDLPPPPRDQPWSYTPTPVSESAPFGEGESDEGEPKEEEEEEEDGEEEE